MAPKAVSNGSTKIATTPDVLEEVCDPKNPYPGHIEELKMVHDILTKITHKNTQKDKALKHLEGVIRRLQESRKRKGSRNQKTRKCWKGS
jgi:hypothetical protein